jgi:hypothetical protein
MKTKSYKELMALKREKEQEVGEIEKKYLPVIKRYWDLKDELSRITPLLNKAMMKEDKIRK